MLGDCCDFTGREEMKRSKHDEEEAPHAKRKKIQAEALDSALVRIQTVAQDSEPLSTLQSTQVKTNSRVVNKTLVLLHVLIKE